MLYFNNNESSPGVTISMKKTFTILLLFSACITGPIMAAPEADAEFIDTMELGLRGGYRIDQFDWNIAGYNQSGQYVNILSELDWEDLESWQLGASGKLVFANNAGSIRVYSRGSIDYGWITDGSLRDSDYDGNDRTLESYRFISDTKDDNVFDISIGLGLERNFWQDRFTLGLLGGYSYHEQNLRLTNGAQVIPVISPIPGLNSTYDARWKGPLAGVDLELRPVPQVSLYGSLEYHWLDYEAEADWNLRTDWAHPLSFRHEANEADGIVLSLKGSYLLQNNLALDLAYVYQDFSTGAGTDVTFLADGTSIVTRFNEANWQSSAFTLGVTYSF